VEYKHKGSTKNAQSPQRNLFYFGFERDIFFSQIAQICPDMPRYTLIFPMFRINHKVAPRMHKEHQEYSLYIVKRKIPIAI
jgi:hypothetical protein